MSLDQLMALVPIENAVSNNTNSGKRSRWDKIATRQHGKSRWSSTDDKPFKPPAFIDLPPGLSLVQLDQFLREQRLEELCKKLSVPELEYGDPDIRDLSPPPIYDRNGNRTNTREMRVKGAMQSEYQRLVEFAVKYVDGYVPPFDYRPTKKIKRIIIPQDKYPEYNFMGLIIGPRGCNHKRLEAESGAQISIRGRGTQKEGKKTDQSDEEAAMAQHVHISADSEESLDKAVNLIEPLLDPFHPMHEEFKKRGLEQLALVNGVQLIKSDQRCSICAAVGHPSWDCPDAQFQTIKKAEVRCAYCGDMGHVTMDCKLAKEKSMTTSELRKFNEETQAKERTNFTHPSFALRSRVYSINNERPFNPSLPMHHDSWKIDTEYQRMMSELGGDAKSPYNNSRVPNYLPTIITPNIASAGILQKDHLRQSMIGYNESIINRVKNFNCCDDQPSLSQPSVFQNAYAKHEASINNNYPQTFRNPMELQNNLLHFPPGMKLNVSEQCDLTDYLYPIYKGSDLIPIPNNNDAAVVYDTPLPTGEAPPLPL